MAPQGALPASKKSANAVSLCRCNHAGADTTFDRASRVAALQLDVDVAVADVIDFYQWGVADRFGIVAVNL